jgi:hypothetical protein
MANRSTGKKAKTQRPYAWHHPPSDILVQRYEENKSLMAAQPPMIQRFLEVQGRNLAEAVVSGSPQAKFTLPDKLVVDPAAGGKTSAVPADYREQLAGGLIDRLTRTDLVSVLRQRLNELEGQTNRAVSTSAALLRFATVVHMVNNMLPSGRTVEYREADGEEIPSIPVGSEMEPESAITATTDAIVEEGESEAGRGELLVPFVPYARRFYLPQWVAFNEKGDLIVSSSAQAEAHVASMQNFLRVLHMAVSLAPFIVADEEYQRKRYGILGQLVNQGRALACYETKEIINTIMRRSAANDLNRGLRLSLPFFDDQDLTIQNHELEIIPAGRVMFVPAFVVLAAREEQAKVEQDTRLSPSTRKHLLSELRMLEKAFDIQKKA